MYINTYISVTKDPRIHNRGGLQVPWCVACNVAIGWNCWRAKALCSFSRSLGPFFSWQTLREILPETNSVFKHLKHWGLVQGGYLLGSGKLMEGIRCDYDGSTDEHEDGQGL